jgi:hypothetical protein
MRIGIHLFHTMYHLFCFPNISISSHLLNQSQYLHLHAREIGTSNSLIISRVNNDTLIANESFVAGCEGGKHIYVTISHHPLVSKLMCSAVGSRDLRSLEFATSCDITSLPTHITNLAEIFLRFIAHAVCGNDVRIKVSGRAGAISILNNAISNRYLQVRNTYVPYKWNWLGVNVVHEWCALFW